MSAACTGCQATPKVDGGPLVVQTLDGTGPRLLGGDQCRPGRRHLRPFLIDLGLRRRRPLVGSGGLLLGPLRLPGQVSDLGRAAPPTFGEGARRPGPLVGGDQPGGVDLTIGASGRRRPQQRRFEAALGRQPGNGGRRLAGREERSPYVVAGGGQVGDGSAVGGAGPVGGRLRRPRRHLEGGDPLLAVDEVLMGPVALAALELTALGLPIGALPAVRGERLLRPRRGDGRFVDCSAQLAGGADGPGSARLRLLDRHRPAGEHGAGVAAVVAEELPEGEGGPSRTVDLVADGLEVVEVAGGLGEHPLVDRREGRAQDPGQLTGLDLVADVRVAEGVQQVEQVAVASLVEQPEHVPPDPTAVLGPRGGDGIVAEGVLQALDREALAGDVEFEVDTDPAVGEEEPAVGPAGGGRRLEAGPQRLERLAPVVVDAPQLEPDVADVVAVGTALGHQPADGGSVATGGVERPGVAVEEEGQQDLERLRLAGAVLSPQQQPAAREAQLDPVVLPDVEDAGAVQHPSPHRARAVIVGRLGQVSPGGAARQQVGGHEGASVDSNENARGTTTTSGA